jgi:hypothetical protein
VTGRHAGQNTGSTDYAYTGRHEAPASPGCTEFVHVNDSNGEVQGLLVCDRASHDDPQHFDAADGILWQYGPALKPKQAAPAGAVA